MLKGLIRCNACNTSMQPTHSKKKNREYRYYVCGRHLKGRECHGKDHTVPAGEIEQVIMEEIPIIISNSELMEQAFKDVKEIVFGTLQGISKMWGNIFPEEQKEIIQLLIKTIWFQENGFKIEISRKGLRSLVEKYKANNEKIEAKGEDISVFIEYKLKKCRGKSMVLVLSEGEIKRNNLLLKSLVRAQLWQQQMNDGEYANIKEICSANKIACPKYVSSILQLNFLAPKIKEAILEGNQPSHVRLNNFLGTKMNMLWEVQLERFR